MPALILGLLIFLGVHSVRIVADPWRSAQIERIGAGRWKGLYSLASIVGFVLILWGYGLARTTPVDLWQPPAWTRLATTVLTLPAFFLLAAAYVPGTKTKAALHHPMILGVKLWAFAHLLSNGGLADVLLFGGFFVWAVFNFRAARQRDRAAGTSYRAGAVSADVTAGAIGIGAWILFATFLHAWLIGVQPF